MALPAVITEQPLTGADLATVPPEALWLRNFTAERTRETYRQAVAAFIAFHRLPSIAALRTVSQAHVLAWREQLLAEGCSPRTVSNRLAALSSLFKDLADRQLVTQNPVSGVRRPRVSNARVTAVVLTAAQARRLLAAPDLETLQGLRDAAYLHILLYSGCRISEVRGLQVKDYFEDAGYRVLELTVKGGRRHRVPVNQEVQIAIRRYLERAGHGACPEAALLQPVKASGKPGRSVREGLSRQQLAAIFRGYAEVLGLPDQVTPHSTRATFATIGLESGVPIERMQDQLGHRNINTTRLYCKGQASYRDSPAFRVHY